MPELRLTPAQIVNSDTPVGDCVRRMRDQGVGSVLVQGVSHPHSLLGIFTERDLLKWIDKIQHGGYWDKPVALLMSKPVVTISIFELDRGPQLMLDGGIRNLPVIYDNELGETKIAGVISIKDLFRRLSELWATDAPPPISESADFSVALACRDKDRREELRRVFSQGSLVRVQDFALPDLAGLQDRRRASLAVVDLDGQPPEAWLKTLRALAGQPAGPFALPIYTPSLHDARNLSVLKELAKEGRIVGHARPVCVLDALHQVRIWRGSRVRLI